MDDEELTSLLIMAAEERLGISVSTTDPERLRSYLYPIMKKRQVSFKLRIPPQPGRLWILKESKGAQK